MNQRVFCIRNVRQGHLSLQFFQFCPCFHHCTVALEAALTSTLSVEVPSMPALQVCCFNKSACTRTHTTHTHTHTHSDRSLTNIITPANTVNTLPRRAPTSALFSNGSFNKSNTKLMNKPHQPFPRLFLQTSDLQTLPRCWMHVASHSATAEILSIDLDLLRVWCSI